MAPSPELQEKINKALKKMRQAAPDGMAHMAALRQLPRVGFNDGLIVPGDLLPVGTPPAVARNMALERAPLRGTVNVVVVLAEFSDRQFGANATVAHFEELFFSTGQLATGSVREYYTEATNGLVTIAGQVVGPYTLPNTLANYANGASGTGNTNPNSRDMARDAALAANADVNFSVYDNDGDGFVDAYVVVHAGMGAEQTGSGGDIWSHKWVMRSQLNADGTQLFAYLTIPENARIGVCAHELGHLLFGFPDLYDTDSSSEGVGNWCLMGGGSWNGGGQTPAHPSAWCKANQGWATVTNVTSNGVRSIQAVETGHEIFRLWKDGGASQEYFLVENRQKTGFDSGLPGEGLCIWHIDEAISTNSNEAHPKVALEQADGKDDLGTAANRGDAGDVYPGSAGKTIFDNGSSPGSRSYAGNDTCVAVASISASGPTMTADLRVRCGKSVVKDVSDKGRDKRLEKRPDKIGEKRPDKLWDKSVVEDKRPDKPEIDKRSGYDKGWDYDYRDRFGRAPERHGDLERRVEALESAFGGLAPFIDSSLRPDLEGSGLSAEEDLARMRDEMEQQTQSDKRLLDSPTHRR
ncbi:MAG: M6 family metalloprotease domain-containing protein [Geminicoccaceae bacterium]|nr:M6 family metalloprotease domain-containing protein [Geminicoccaceae bacterium]